MFPLFYYYKQYKPHPFFYFFKYSCYYTRKIQRIITTTKNIHIFPFCCGKLQTCKSRLNKYNKPSGIHHPVSITISWPILFHLNTPFPNLHYVCILTDNVKWISKKVVSLTLPEQHLKAHSFTNSIYPFATWQTTHTYTHTQNISIYSSIIIRKGFFP